MPLSMDGSVAAAASLIPTVFDTSTAGGVDGIGAGGRGSSGALGVPSTQRPSRLHLL